uniref:Uncharacterized protein n=1 Tax=Romanomermis culicivorax TaxID=13658 RepID=A0A915JW70_ROMCU
MLAYLLVRQPPKVLPPPIFLVPSCLGVALATQPTPNYGGDTLDSFDMEFIMAADMQHFKFIITMPADTTASSYPHYVQLAFPNGTMFVFEMFTATPEDWTPLFSLVDA